MGQGSGTNIVQQVQNVVHIVAKKSMSLPRNADIAENGWQRM